MLTNAQLAALKADIAADGSLAPLIAAGNIRGIKNLYNAPTATPCWRTSLPFNEAWAGVDKAEYITLPQGNRDAFALMFREGSINPSLAGVRADFLAIIPAQATATRAGLTAVSQRLCTRAELLFATGAAVKTLVFEGHIGNDDLIAARRLP